MPSEQVRLAPEPSSVGSARAMLREALTRWDLDDLEFAASQALTELATNAVIHARTEFVVSVTWENEVLRVCVEDSSPRLPAQRNYAIDATTGRGLALVDRLCHSWGIERTDVGKRVWFEVIEGEDAFGDDGDLLALFDDDGDEETANGRGAVVLDLVA